MSRTNNLSLSVDPQGRLVLVTADGRRHVGLEPVRLFPLTDPTRWVSLCDGSGRELALIEDLGTLTPQLRTAIEAELARREFIPNVLKITHVTGSTHPQEWRIVTDRGPTTFELDGDDHLRALGPHRILITDTSGLRYQIPDTRTLDAASRRLLERHL